MKLLIFLVLLISVTATLAKNKVRYDNVRVYRVKPATTRAVAALKSLENHHLGFRFWSKIIAKNSNVDIMVPPHLRSEFSDIIKNIGLKPQLFISNVQQLIDNERAKVRSGRAFGWDDYYTLDEIYAWLDTLAETYPQQVTVLSAGTSFEGRDIKGIHVSFAPGNTNNTVFLESNIHANEWIASAVSSYILNELLTSADPNVRAVADTHDWYYFPVVNPDGFVHTHTIDRFWRKTRQPYGICHGADPNRNWDYHYNEGGTSDFECDDKYRGPFAFSEPESKSLSEFITTIGPQLVGYIGFHSYSQIFLVPYGYTADHLDNYDDLYSVGLKAAESLAQRYGTNFTVGNVAEILYVASGGSIDWVKGTYQTPITYTYELRDTGEFGIFLPADQIIPSGEETLDSFVRIFQEFDTILPKKNH